MMQSIVTPDVAYYNDILDENIVQYLNDLIIVKTEDQDEYTKSCTIEFNDYKSESTKKIINIVKQFFERAGLPVDENQGYIEYCLNYSYGYGKDDFHCQNDEFDEDVHVCYLITNINKDNKLEICIEKPDFLSIVGFKEQKTREFPLQQGTIFIASGDTYYRFQECTSMNYISVVLNKKNTESHDKKE